MVSKDDEKDEGLSYFSEDTHVVFDNGVVRGTGYIRGVALQPSPLIGATYIVEAETCNMNKDTYPYTCLGIFACHLSVLT